MKASARTCEPSHPVRQRLCPARLGVGVAGGAHHGDEDLRRSDLASVCVVQLDSLPGIIDEHAFAGGVGLPHRRRQPAPPAAVELAPAAITVAVGRRLLVLLPQQHQGDAGTAQLMMDVRPIRLGLAPHAALTAGAGVEHRLQHPVAQRCRQRPAQRRRRKTVEGHRHCAARNPQRSGDRPVRRAAFMLETQDLAYPSHRHSLGWHRLPHSSWPRRAQEPSRPAVERSPPLPGVADFKSEWPSSNRNRGPTSFRNQWPACSGISRYKGSRRIDAALHKKIHIEAKKGLGV